MSFAVLPVIAFTISLSLHTVACTMFPRWGLLDFPERYGLRRGRIPYPSGIVPVVTFVLFFLTVEPWTMQNIGITCAILLIALFSFLDDRRPLPAILRLSAQIAASFLIFATGSRIYSLTNPLPFLTGSPILPLDSITVAVAPFGLLPVFSGIFTVVWLGLTTNALNWFDGIPGQVGVLATIGFVTIAFLALRPNVDQPQVALLATILASVSAGGLFFDLPPPRLLMGDTGAMFYGLMLGILTIYAGGKVATAFLVLGVPLVDFVIVAGRRLLHGRSPLKSYGDAEHLHHRLLRRGWSPEHIILLTAGIGTCFGVAALFLDTFAKFLAGLSLFLLMIFLSWYSGRTKA